MRYIYLLRIYQWPKNLLLFVAIITSQSITFLNFYYLSISFLCFCLAASAGYILNDLLDLKSDQLHYIKKKRMIASGIVKFNEAIFIIVVLILFSLILSILVPKLIKYIILYLLLSFIYS